MQTNYGATSARSNLTAADVRKDRNWLWRQNAGEDLTWFKSRAPINDRDSG
jgi:hypothetical protein